MPRTIPSQVRRFIASGPVIVLLAALSPGIAQQKPAPPSPNPQAQLEEHVKELEKRLNDAEQKAASAAIEKEYITRVQKQYESYYKEVLSTQTWTLAIFGFILTAVFGLAARFGIQIFDSRTKSVLDAAVVQLEKKFSEQMQKELGTLREQNSVQLNALENGLTKQITDLEQDLETRSEFQFHFAQGLASSADHQWAFARDGFRTALWNYKRGKPKDLIEKRAGVVALQDVFVTFLHEDQANFEKNATEELASKLYNGLEDELALAAIALPELAPLLKEKKTAAPPAAG